MTSVNLDSQNTTVVLLFKEQKHAYKARNKKKFVVWLCALCVDQTGEHWNMKWGTDDVSPTLKTSMLLQFKIHFNNSCIFSISFSSPEIHFSGLPGTWFVSKEPREDRQMGLWTQRLPT